MAPHQFKERILLAVTGLSRPTVHAAGEELIRQLETRLDAVVLRLGFALTQRQARQLVSHGHVTVNGRSLPAAPVPVSQRVSGARRSGRPPSPWSRP